MSEASGSGPDRRPRLDPASAAIRNALRAWLGTDAVTVGSAGTVDSPDPASSPSHATPASYVLAVSGGTDSLALAAAAAHVGSGPGVGFLACIVDHGLQEGSREVAEAAAAQVRALGLPAVVRTVSVVPGPAGLEADARAARYAALESVRADAGAAAVLTAHTLDDQAETVLLGLLRGSGARSLAGMRERSGTLGRPLLSITREQTAASVAALGLKPWHDPMNHDAAYSRVRVRHSLLPTLAAELGPGVRRALARTAAQLGPDTDHLDALAARELPAHASGAVLRSSAADLPEAVRTRVVRDWVRGRAGYAQEIGFDHVRAIDALLTGERRGAVSVPGGAEVRRTRSGDLDHVRLTQGPGALRNMRS